METALLLKFDKDFFFISKAQKSSFSIKHDNI